VDSCKGLAEKKYICGVLIYNIIAMQIKQIQQYVRSLCKGATYKNITSWILFH
jgi:hypothetical protein